MRISTWRCHLCKSWGLNGPGGWLQHYDVQHANRPARYGAQVWFGFTGNYSSGMERRYDRQISPAVAAVRGES